MRRVPLWPLLACALFAGSAVHAGPELPTSQDPAGAQAALRSPQVPVSGSALATFFASQSQAISPTSDQLDLQQLNVSTNTSFEVRTFGSELTASAGAYNSLAPTPALYQIWPGSALPGWYPVCSFRSGPTRLVVNLFDNTNALQGTTTYLGADPSAFGFYGQGPSGTVYQQDFRNAFGGARILAYAGTGARSGYTWFAIETTSTANGDYADLVLLVNLGLVPVDVQQSSWSSLKQRFR